MKRMVKYILLLCPIVCCLVACGGRLEETGEQLPEITLTDGSIFPVSDELNTEELSAEAFGTGELTTEKFSTVDFNTGELSAEDGKLRIPYTINQNSVRCITSPLNLPSEMQDYQDIYNDDFFAHSALLLVIETTNSGSTRVGISEISREGDSVYITLFYEVQETGTNDMATWLLWKEVDREFAECDIEIVNHF